MRKVVFFFAFVFIKLSGFSQIVLNEVYTDPAKGNSEFIELYNTSFTDILSLDCYSIAIYFDDGANYRGFYVLDLPDVPIKARSYVVGAGTTKTDNTFTSQAGSATATFNWQNFSGTIGGSVKKYIANNYDNPTFYYPPSALSTSELNDLIPLTNRVNNKIYTAFLFNNGVYTNGFIGNAEGGTIAVPNFITAMPKLILSSVNCPLNAQVDWTNVKLAESAKSAGGNENGYYRTKDALCGSWQKAAPGPSYTPNNPNSNLSRTDISTGSLSTLEVINCNNKLEIQVTSLANSYLYPVTVIIIRDVNSNSAVDLSGTNPDVVLSNKIVNAPMNVPLEFSNIFDLRNLIIVYQTSTGCIDRVVSPETPKGTYITSTVRFCNTIQYGISGLSGGALNRFATPVDVQIFEDLGLVGYYEPNVDRFITAISYDSTAINTGTKTYSIPTELLSSPLIVVYAPSKYNCFITSKIDYLKAISGSLTTTESLVCNTLSVGITGRVGDAANLVNSVLVELYGINADGTYAPKFSTTLNLTNFTGTLSSFNVASYIYPSYELRYIPAGYTCLSKTATIQPKVVALKTNEGVVCKSVVFGVSGLSGNAPELADSVTVQLFGKNIDGTSVFLANQRFRAPFPSNGWSGNFDIAINQYANYELRYLVSNYSCFTKIVSVANAAITYETSQVDYCGKQIGITVQKPVNLSPSLAFSVKAYIVLKDNGIVGTYEPGIDLVSSINPIELKEFPGSIKFASVPFDAAGQAFSIGFETPYPCLNKVVPISPATAAMQTVQSSFCGANTDPSTVTFGISNLTGAASAFGYPISVDLYFTKDLTAKVASASITEVPSTGSFSIPYTDRGKQLSIVYTAVNNCFSSSSIIPAACTITPVKFSYFTAQRNNANANQVQLTWSTAMEQNNKGFYMQRMTGGKWEDISFIGSTALQGNSTVPIKYQFRDINLFGGTSFYRLLQVDHDGKTDYSDVKSIYGPEKGDQRLVIYPNPAKGGSTTVAFPTNTSREIMLFDAFGQVLKQWRGYTGSRLQINQLQPGLYTIKVASGDKAPPIIERIIVQ
ncbi:Por secretion system C-terminal sorting domain-containing protein [Cnuella takakiae]|uniref:Por secretion system C-terminal sorting domain-containing protein n=1 Tax=Cnuella takakiae TaxID=1302690 RepID=A0A1M5ILU0_9BACT|nr:T9SS type A sorting domain-containing protein [Cnuella takakiae]OLY92236.1 hypothetical protein BUE76_10290 [Cnuella takakiae]SHG29288.1 Por secretion system C-terminal sorting domain-containing protein [Cnuella takakiae]